mmetsp:Transcript_13147/g.31117  ORF Transcript_13147/g.31117 Transcript_13147/m.31117 type:complete len:113 (+) Transcript_13147:2403-2741(+)
MYEDAAGTEDEQVDTTQPSSNLDGLGQEPTAGVPIAAGTPTGATEERETIEEPRHVTPERKLRSKRGCSLRFPKQRYPKHQKKTTRSSSSKSKKQSSGRRPTKSQQGTTPVV